MQMYARTDAGIAHGDTHSQTSNSHAWEYEDRSASKSIAAWTER